jgi:putative SOS response-associated peptidase YedK
MTDPVLPLPGLSPVSRKTIAAKFDGGLLSSDGGVPFFREIEQRLGVAERLAACLLVRVADGEREMAMARWGMPSPQFALKGKTTDPGVTNVRNTASPHWRRWLGPESPGKSCPRTSSGSPC